MTAPEKMTRMEKEKAEEKLSLKAGQSPEMKTKAEVIMKTPEAKQMSILTTPTNEGNETSGDDDDDIFNVYRKAGRGLIHFSSDDAFSSPVSDNNENNAKRKLKSKTERKKKKCGRQRGQIQIAVRPSEVRELANKLISKLKTDRKLKAGGYKVYMEILKEIDGSDSETSPLQSRSTQALHGIWQRYLRKNPVKYSHTEEDADVLQRGYYAPGMEKQNKNRFDKKNFEPNVENKKESLESAAESTCETYDSSVSPDVMQSYAFGVRRALEEVMKLASIPKETQEKEVAKTLFCVFDQFEAHVNLIKTKLHVDVKKS